MKQYKALIQEVVDNGSFRPDRTGTGTFGYFGLQQEWDLRKGFPLVTGKKTNFDMIATELHWFLLGGTNTRYLTDRGCKIWNEWADEKGELGPVYGKQWRSWLDSEGFTHDQLETLIDGLIGNPYGRRHIVSAWNTGDLQRMALEPCHILFQCHVQDGVLSLHMYQRSADLFLGVPYNIASYAYLLHLLAAYTGLTVGRLIVSYGDIHIYNNHQQQIAEYMHSPTYTLPELILDVDAVKRSDLLTQLPDKPYTLVEYEHGPYIAAKVAV